MRAPYELAQLVVPGMQARKQGWILNITSRAGVHAQGPPFDPVYKQGFTVYGMVKAALDRFTTGLAAELYDDGIAVNSLAPWDNVATPGAGAHDLVDGFALEGPEWIAEAAAALCTSDPSRLTGRVAYSQPLLAELQRRPRDRLMSSLPFTGRVSIVTGGTRGIGAAVTERLVGEGAHVAAVYARDDEAAKALASRLADGPGSVSLHRADIGDADACRVVVAAVVDEHGRVDHLVNNAGLLVENRARDMTLDEWDAAIRVNLSAAFYLRPGGIGADDRAGLRPDRQHQLGHRR